MHNKRSSAFDSGSGSEVDDDTHEEEVDLSSLPPEERRKAVRRQKNRESARRVRARRMQELGDLNKKISGLSEENQGLRTHIAQLQGHMQAMTSRIYELTNKCEVITNENIQLKTELQTLRLKLMHRDSSTNSGQELVCPQPGTANNPLMQPLGLSVGPLPPAETHGGSQLLQLLERARARRDSYTGSQYTGDSCLSTSSHMAGHVMGGQVDRASKRNLGMGFGGTGAQTSSGPDSQNMSAMQQQSMSQMTGANVQLSMAMALHSLDRAVLAPPSQGKQEHTPSPPQPQPQPQGTSFFQMPQQPQPQASLLGAGSLPSFHSPGDGGW